MALLQNVDKHHMETDMEKKESLDPEALKKDLAEEKPPSELED